MGVKDIPELVSFLQEFKVKVIEEDENIIDIISNFINITNDDNAFFIVHLGKVLEQFQLWTTMLPRVKPFYAVKCNPSPAIIQLLKNYNVGFDCASMHEIRTVMEQGVSPENIVFANPCKAPDQIKYARSEDIDLLTFDDINELWKIKLYHPSANLIIRITTDDSKSECKFSCKFGVKPENVEDVLRAAKFMGMNVVGVSFHVGSNCHDAETFYKSIRDAHDVFETAKKIGFDFNILDVGGGFPGYVKEGQVTFEEIADEINRGLDDFFGDRDDVQFMAEPGRFIVSASHTLVVNVIGKKEIISKVPGEEKRMVYTLNDGVYGSFNCIHFDHATPKIYPYNERNGKLYSSKIYGPTCDSIDIVSEECKLPDLALGERLYVENFGAYTLAAASTFNGFQQTKSVYCI